MAAASPRSSKISFTKPSKKVFSLFMRRSPIRRPHAWALAGLILVTVLAVAGFGLALKAQAQTSFSVESIGSQVGLGNADLKQVIINVIKWVLGILTLTAVVYMMYGGYLWL